MGGSSVDGGSGKSHGKRKAKDPPGGGRSKKIKTHQVKTSFIEQDSDSASEKGAGSRDGSEEEYIVEDILKKRKQQGVWMYYIKWLGWKSNANTWEPKENLTGCEELLEKFEEEWAQKEKSADRRSSSEETVMLTKTKPGPSSSVKASKVEKKNSDRDAREHSSTPARTARVEEKVDKVDKSDSDKNYEDLDILDECPDGRVPNKLIGVVPISDVLVYCVEWEPPEEETEEFNEPISLVRGEVFSSRFPEMVIKFYENHIIWAKDPKDEAKLLQDSCLSHDSKKPKSLASNNSNMNDSEDEPLAIVHKNSQKKADNSDDSDHSGV